MICAADATKLPEAAQAFGERALRRCYLGGRPAPIYTGLAKAEDLGDVLSQVLQLAAQYQLPGGFDPVVPEDEKPPAAPARRSCRRPRPRRSGGARAAYRKAISENPGDKEGSSAWNRLNCLPA